MESNSGTVSLRGSEVESDLSLQNIMSVIVKKPGIKLPEFVHPVGIGCVVEVPR